MKEERDINLEEEKLSLTKNVLEAYEYLLDTIRDYRFKVGSEKKNTKGAKQNATTEEIVREIDSFQKAFMESLDKIDYYFEDEEKESKDYEIEVIQGMKALTEMLYNQKEKMEQAQNMYYEAWAKAYKIIKSDGDKKEANQLIRSAQKNWKTERNNSASAISITYRTIRRFDGTIDLKEGRDIPVSKDARFDSGINRMANSAHAFCYLTAEERKEAEKSGKEAIKRIFYR